MTYEELWRWIGDLTKEQRSTPVVVLYRDSEDNEGTLLEIDRCVLLKIFEDVENKLQPLPVLVIDD